MDLSTILTGIGIIVTVVLGVLAIIVSLQSTRGVQITFARDRCTPLLDEFSRNFNELEIRYKSQPIGENLLFLRAYLINTGKKDITPGMIENKIKMGIDKRFAFAECTVVESSPSLSSKVTIIEPSTIEFDTGLWKTKEYLKFDALINVPDQPKKEDNKGGTEEGLNKILINSIAFEHRIADSSEISQTRIPYERPGLGSRQMGSKFGFLISRRIYLVTSLVAILLGCIFFLYGRYAPLKETAFKMKIDNSYQVGTISASKDSLVISGDNNFVKKMSPADFCEAFAGEVYIIPSHSQITQYSIMGAVYVAMGIFILLMPLYIYFRQNRILRIIRIAAKQ